MAPRQTQAAGVLLTTAVAIAGPATAAAPEAQETLEEVIVVAPYGYLLPRNRVPGNVQVATAEQIERSQSLDLTDYLNRSFSSVTINHAQNNPLQPDVSFRGFTASPLLGLPPGLSVYQNGVRINEPFGDTVNWDLIPLSAVGDVQLLAGANPVFGLNTLGGALSLRMKNGFDFPTTAAEVDGGSFERWTGFAEHGGNNGRWGFYANVDYFQEDGWRDFSASDALRFYGSVSFRTDVSTLDLSLGYADTELRGNGPSPAELLEIDRTQVFTHPDLTENTLASVSLEGSHRLSDATRIAGNVFYREIDTDSFNGDGAIFEECDVDGEEFLVEEDFIDLNGDGECSSEDDEDVEVVLDLDGEPIEAEIDDEEQNAVNNIGEREQEVYGASLQFNLHSNAGGRENDLTLGVGFSEAETTFGSNVEIAQLLEDRSTSRTSIYAAEFVTGVASETSIASVYFADAWDVAKAVTLTVAGRYDSTRIRLTDQTGASPELNGSHRFDRFNPAAGVTFRASPSMLAYASASQSARTPTPVELACADEEAPCNLPNAFLADPPLDEVVATSYEAGLRGEAASLRWHIGAFHTTNEDDILFQTTGGAQANVGFFNNVADTQRVGVELSLAQDRGRMDWSVKYSLIEATFEDSFVVNSPNHPVFEEDGSSSSIVGEDKLLVPSGSDIPGIPRHQASAGLDFAFNDALSIGADVVYRSGVHLRGDEPNLLGKTDSYAILNLRGEYRFNDHVMVFARVENVFDEDYETFGLLGEPDEVFEDFEDPRFFSPGPPLGAWVGVKLKL
jgi:outer membrane receptor protein involved in Fe transport